MFDVLNVDLFVKNKWFDECVWFLFFSLSSDVSTLQKNDYCKNHSKINELTDSRTKRSFIDWLTDSKNKKIGYWLTDWFEKQEDRLLIAVVTNSLIDWLSKQKNQQLTVIFANSRSFSLTHDAHNESEMQSSFSKKEFQIGDFLLICVFLQMIWRFSFKHSRIFTNDEDIVSTRFFYELLTIFFYLAYFYETDDFI